MSNNLKKMEKDLRAFAKRSKDVKYTKGLLFSFLLMGMLTFSDTLTSPEVKSTENAINQTRKELNTSINDLHVAFRQAKRENNRLLKNANLELIQLMEQGDQVVKSPWSSWQMGMNFFYNNWRGTYKGHGDKQPDQIFKRDTTLARFQKNLSNGKYGTTDLDLVDEPLAEISVSAGVRPKIINKQLPNLQLPRVNAPNSPALNITLASPEPITPPTITPPNINPEIVSPNAEPFSDFMWGWLYEKPGYLPSWAAQSNLESDSGANFSFGDNIDISGGTFWSGVDENGNLGNVAGYKDATQDTTKWNAANFNK